MRRAKRAFAGILCAALLGVAGSAALANPAHHQAGGGTPSPPEMTVSPAPAVPAPAPAAGPSNQVALSIDDGGIPAPATAGTAGEVAVTDSTELGVGLDKDARQPTLYDLMMRIMNLMQPHMKEMMGGIPAPDPAAAPNLVVDLANPLGVKSAAKATPETGGSVKRLTAEVEALKQQLAQVLAALKAQTGGAAPAAPNGAGSPPAETRLSL